MKTKELIFIAVSVFAFIVLIQNTQVVTIKVLFWHLGMSKIILLIIAFLFGLISGYMLNKRIR